MVKNNIKPALKCIKMHNFNVKIAKKKS